VNLRGEEAAMLKFLWKMISDDERSENTVALLVVVLSLVALAWLALR
jgi:hypothetical protein